MNTRTKKSASAVNNPNIKENPRRQPLSDKTNNVNTSTKMKRKKNEKQPTLVTSKIEMRQTRTNSVRSRRNDAKNEVGLDLDTNDTISNILKSTNARKIKNKTVGNETKTTCKSDVKNNSSRLNDSLKETLEGQKDTNVKNPINEQNRLNVRRRSTRFSSDKATSKSGSNKDVSRSNKDVSKLDSTIQENPQQMNETNNLLIKLNEKSETDNIINADKENEENKENLTNAPNKLNVRRRSSRFSSKTKFKTTSKSNKNDSKSNKDASKSKKDVSKSNTDVLKSNKNVSKYTKVVSKSNGEASKYNKDTAKSNEDALKLDTTQKTDKIIDSDKQNKEKTPLRTRRLLNCLKSPSPEDSDPYEFKFDPKKEPKRKPKKRVRPKKYDTLSDTSEEEDNSMKPIIKNIRRKVEIKQKKHLTPVERKLRNRLVKVDNQAGLAPQINVENNLKICEKIALNTDIIKINKAAKKTSVVDEINIAAKNASVVDEINSIANNVSVVDEINTTAKNASVVDEINEIANTFLEDDDVFNESNVSVSSPSRIDIISNLIARKSIIKPAANVFNSTMIHQTPKQQPLAHAQSPWRVEVSAIPRKSFNFSVKNKSFTPSYTPDITDNKKQSTLLGFVNRTPKSDLPVTLFQNSPTRKPFENLSNSMSPIRPNRSNISAAKRSDDSLFGFTVLSDSEDKENSPVVAKVKSPRNINKQNKKQLETNKPNIKQLEIKKQTPERVVKINECVKIDEPSIDISIALFEDIPEKINEKRYSRQYTRPQTKRKRKVSLKIDSDDDDSDSETEIHPVKKKQKDVLTKEEAEEAERLASHYNSYFEEIENYSLCIE